MFIAGRWRKLVPVKGIPYSSRENGGHSKASIRSSGWSAADQCEESLMIKVDHGDDQPEKISWRSSAFSSFRLGSACHSMQINEAVSSTMYVHVQNCTCMPSRRY